MTAIEFALTAPVFLLLLLASFDFGHEIYARSVLQGVVQDAGRDAGLESGSSNLSVIDNMVLSQVQNVVPEGAILTSRRNYQGFNDVGKPEDFVDADGDGEYDADECFTDLNENDQWDPDRGADGLGGADDVVLYTALLTYDRPTPLWRFIGTDSKAQISASTTLRNQPFGDQAARTEVQICP
ncbi:MAG: pilus assembly protein [Caenibius sp.]